MRTLEHRLLGLGVGFPAAARLEVHRRELPLLERIADAHRKAEVLLLVGDREPVFDELDAGADQHALELRARAEELLDIGFRAETHDTLDAGAIVPTAIEEHDLAGGREVRGVTLEVPLCALALVRCGKRGNAADARVQPLRDALDDAALAGRVTAFENDDDLELLLHDPVLQLDQLALEAKQLLEVDLAVEARELRAPFGAFRALVLELQLELLVEAVEHLGLDFRGDRIALGHGHASSMM